jgi:hypothetical protein
LQLAELLRAKKVTKLAAGRILKLSARPKQQLGQKDRSEDKQQAEMQLATRPSTKGS